MKLLNSGMVIPKTSSKSLWAETAPAASPRARLEADAEFDFIIVGAGFTGLWTAYWLLQNEPSASIAVVEAVSVGFGASGRNGGWFSALFPADLDKLQKISTPDAAIAMQRAMFDVVDQTGQLLANHNLNVDWQQGGTITGIRTAVQEARAEAELKWWREWGFDESHFDLLDSKSAFEKIQMSDLRGASFTPHCARVHPLKLVRGIAELVEKAGGRIFENSPVTRLTAKSIELETGIRATARVSVVRATEAYTSYLPQQKREIAPVYSLMVATPPLPDSVMAQIGLANSETFADYRHLIIYGQRTADNRIAFGGRGAPYHFASNIDPKHEIHPPTHTAIWRELVEVFPVLAEYSPTHEWGGALGIPRDWTASVNQHPAGFYQAGGYVGDGLGTSALAGKTLADLLTEKNSELTSLPWVNHRSRKWEFEPLRYLGVTAGLKVMSIADAEERITNRPSMIAKTFNRLIRS